MNTDLLTNRGRGRLSLFLLSALWLALSCLSPAFAQAIEPTQPYFTALSQTPTVGRQGAVAVPLPGGDVLIAGGADQLPLRSAEIFDPATSNFTAVPGLTRVKRVRAVAAPLPDGRVLIAGGSGEILQASAEIFDPVAETFAPVSGEMTMGRISGIAAPLPDGRVLIAGGYAEGETLDTAEVFDPATETFTALSGRTWSKRSGAVAVALSGGKVLIAGGYGESKSAHSAETFDPATDGFSLLNSEMTNDNRGAVAALLPNDQILIAGGWNSGSYPIRNAGLLDPDTGAFSALPNSGETELTTERADASAAPLPGGKVLISGGSWPEARDSAELFVSAPAIRLTGGELGTHIVGAPSTPSQLTVSNVGAQTLQIGSVSVTGADTAEFTLTSDSCSGAALDFEEACNISLNFDPLSAGVKEATLAFEDNEPTPTAVSVRGTGVMPSGVPTEEITDTTADQSTKPTEVRRPYWRRCRASKLRATRRVKVVCRLKPRDGRWLALLRHRRHIVARRRSAPGRRRVVFRMPSRRSRGAYWLHVLPLGQSGHPHPRT